MPGADVTVIHNGGERPHVTGLARVIDSPSNGGYTAGANIALRDWLGSGDEWCVIGSHDLHVEPDTFSRMLEIGADHPDVGIIGPRLTNPGAGTGRLLASDSRRFGNEPGGGGRGSLT